MAIREALSEEAPKENNQGRDNKSRLNTGVVAIFCGTTQAAEICAVLGVVLFGGCFVPVDDSLPAPRLREVMEDAQPGAIIASRVLSPSSRLARGGQPVGAVLEAWRQRGCLIVNLEESGQLSNTLREVSTPERQAQRNCARGGEAERHLHHRVGEMRPQFVEPAAAGAAATAVDVLAGVDGDGRVLGVPQPRLVDSPHRAKGVEAGAASPSGSRGLRLADGGVRTGTATAFPDLPDENEDGDLLYILYTSGTTGVPKGVKGTRSGAVNRIRFGWEMCPFRHEGELVSR